MIVVTIYRYDRPQSCGRSCNDLQQSLDIEDGDHLRWWIDDGTLRVEVVQQRRGTFADFDGYDGDEQTNAAVDHDTWGLG